MRSLIELDGMGKPVRLDCKYSPFWRPSYPVSMRSDMRQDILSRVAVEIGSYDDERKEVAVLKVICDIKR